MCGGRERLTWGIEGRALHGLLEWADSLWGLIDRCTNTGAVCSTHTPDGLSGAAPFQPWYPMPASALTPSRVVTFRLYYLRACPLAAHPVPSLSCMLSPPALMPRVLCPARIHSVPQALVAKAPEQASQLLSQGYARFQYRINVFRWENPPSL